MKRSTLTPIVLGLSWILSLGVVYTMGLFTAFAFHAEPGTGSESGLKSTEREAQALFEQLTGEPLDWATLYSYRPRDRHPAQLARIVEALGSLPDPAARRVLTERFFKIVGEVKTAAFLQEHTPLAHEKPEVYRGLLNAWYAFDPSASKDFLEAMVRAGDAPKDWLESF